MGVRAVHCTYEHRLPSAHRGHHVVALDTIHGWQDAWEDGRVLQVVSASLGLFNTSLVEGVSLQEVVFVAESNGIRAVLEGADSLDAIVLALSLPWEQDFVDVKECFLVVNEEIEQVVSVLVRKLTELYSILCQVGKFKKTFFELLGLLRVFIKLTNLLLANDLSLQPSFDHISSDVLHTVNE